MKNFIVGFFCGAALVGTAWAAAGITLVNGNGVEIGTTNNPVVVEIV